MTKFIDAHVHPPVAELLEGPLAVHIDALRKYLREPIAEQTAEQLAEFYRSRDAKAVLLGWNSLVGSGYRALGNETIGALVAAAPDVFYGFGAVEQNGGAGAVAGVHQAARMGLSGLAFHPASEHIVPSAKDGRQIWETAAEHQLVCLVHTGFTRLGAGQPGGAGVGLEPARPIHVDKVAAAHGDLKIILAHSGALWLDEAIAVSLHKSNVHLCLSAVSPKSMSAELLDLIRGPLSDRVHFGSDYPFGNPDAWLAEWDSLGMAPEVTKAVLVDNISRLLAS